MLIKKVKTGRFALENLAPAIERNRILFPISATCEYIKEDGLSFGYPVDDGWITIVEYDFVMGALTDDVIHLINNLKKPSAPSCGIGAIDTYDWSAGECNLWKVGLDSKWAEDEYNNTFEKGLINCSDSKEKWIADQLENYHCWPTDWRQAYDSYHEKLNTPVGSKEIVIVNDSLTLYKDEKGEYFFTTQYFDHGNITKADLDSAEKYIASFKAYEAEMVTYQNLRKQISESLTLLKNTLKNI